MRFAKMFPLTSLGLLANLYLPFASSNVLFLMQIYHDFHFVVAWFGLGAVTGTNGSADLHVKLEIRFSKAALPRAAPRCAQHRITLITGYSANLFSLLQKIQKYIFSRKKKNCEYPCDSVQISQGFLERNLDFCHLLRLCSCINDPENGLTLPLIRGNNSLLLKGPVPFLLHPSLSCIRSGAGAATGRVSSVTWSGRKLSH